MKGERLHMRLCLAVCLLSLALATGASAGLFFDDFTSGPSPWWGHENGTWVVTDGEYHATTGDNYSCIYSSLPWQVTDFTLEFDIKDPLKPYGGGDVGVFFRSSDWGHGYAWILNGGGFTYAHVNTTGGWGPITPGPTGPWTSDVHLRLEATGNIYSGYINGTFIGSMGDLTWPSGKVALYEWGNRRFDNVALTASGVPDVPEPASCALLALAMGGIGVMLKRRKKA